MVLRGTWRWCSTRKSETFATRYKTTVGTQITIVFIAALDSLQYIKLIVIHFEEKTLV